MPLSTRVADLLAGIHTLYLLLLERTGGAEVLARAGLSPEWLAVGVSAAVLLLYGALASGNDPFVRVFRAAAIALAVAQPAFALLNDADPAAVGGALLVLVVCAAVHSGLRQRRRPGLASAAIAAVKIGLETTGLTLMVVAAGLLTAGRSVPLRLAFWSLFLVRLSIAELVVPARLASRAGLNRSALVDVRSGLRRWRLKRAARGAAKLLLLAVWIALPLLSALARGEVERKEWPRAALFLTAYPPAALALSSIYLLARTPRLLRKARLEALRSLLAGLATGVYLALVFASPDFAGYRRSLTGIVVLETMAGFLFGAASEEKRRP